MLAAIVDHGGLTEGAEALGKSQPSVSRTLTQLEARIGAPLFVPGRRPLQPTELGRALADKGRQVLAADAAAAEIVARYRLGKAGHIAVGGTPIFMDGVIAGIIAGFQREQPDIRVDQSYGYSGDLIERLSGGGLDLAICPLRQDSVPDHLTFQPILKGMNVVACRVGHPLCRRTVLRLDDIAQFPWIAPPANSPLYRDLRRALADIGTDSVKISFTGGSLASVVSILSGSDALTILPFSVVYLMRRQKTVTALSLRIGHPDRHLGLLFPREAPAAPAVRRFRGYLASQFETLAQHITQHQQQALWRRS